MYFNNREDLQTWRDRLLGKRLVCSDRHVCEHAGWKTPDPARWEPRVYYCEMANPNHDVAFTYAPQPQSRLLSLPGEIRNQIIGYVLTVDVVRDGHTGRNGGDEERLEWARVAAVVFGCKQLYAEGRDVAVKACTFRWEDLPKRTKLCAYGSGKGRGNGYDYML